MDSAVSIIHIYKFGGGCVIYGYGMMYQILDRYVWNYIDEAEHVFATELKWPNEYLLVVINERFWIEIQNLYDVCISKEDRERINTVADLKTMIDKTV